jgi:hypothetical protein
MTDTDIVQNFFLDIFLEVLDEMQEEAAYAEDTAVDQVTGDLAWT